MTKRWQRCEKKAPQKARGISSFTDRCIVTQNCIKKTHFGFDQLEATKKYETSLKKKERCNMKTEYFRFWKTCPLKMTRGYYASGSDSEQCCINSLRSAIETSRFSFVTGCTARCTARCTTCWLNLLNQYAYTSHFHLITNL